MDANTTAVESSPAAPASPGTPAAPVILEPPRTPAEYREWRQTGKMPEAKLAESKSKEESTPSKSAAETAEKTAPDSETGKHQEKTRNNAETRLNEILRDLKDAGLSPSELKTFRREAKAAAEAQPKVEPERTAKPAEAPKRPKLADFDTYDQFDEALDTWNANRSKEEAKRAVDEYRSQQASEAQTRELQGQVDAATKRYGADAGKIISNAASEIVGDQSINPAVAAILQGSDVLTDVLYTLGSKPEDLAEFVALAKSKPGAAIRKVVLIEQLVREELAGSASKEAPVRGEDGKFQKTTPEPKITKAPPPPKEVSGHGAAPPDEVETAASSADFRRYRDAANRRDIAARKG